MANRIMEAERVDDIAWINRIAESSPVVVLVLLLVLFSGSRAGQALFSALVSRLDAKDVRIAEMHESLLEIHDRTLVAVRDNTEAIRQLGQAIERGDRR